MRALLEAEIKGNKQFMATITRMASGEDKGKIER